MTASPTHHRCDDSVAAVSSGVTPVARVSSASHSRGIPEFSDLLLACRHHLLLTGVVGLVAAISFFAVAWNLVAPSYQAEGFVRVREQQSVIFAAQTTRAQDVAFFRSQAKLVQSPQILSAALRDDALLGLHREIPSEGRVAWLAGLTRVETQSGSEVMSISVGHPSPELAHALSNAITKAYLAEIHHRLISDRDQREQKLRFAAQEADEQLNALWDELDQLAESVGSDNAESMTLRDEMRFQAYRDHARQLQTSNLRGNQLQAQLTEQKLRRDEQVVQPDVTIDGLLQQDAQVISAGKRLSMIQREITQMAKIAVNPDSPQMTRLTLQRDFLTKEFDELSTRIRARISRDLKRKKQTSRVDSLAELKNQIELNRSEQLFLRERLSEIDPVISNVATKTAVPLDMSRHAVNRQSRLADSLWQSLQEMQIESESQERVTLIEFATLPKQANHSRQMKSAAVAGMGGCMLVVFMIGYFEWKDCRVRSPGDIASRSQYPVFGAASHSESSSSFASRSMKHGPSGGVREAAARVLLREQGNTTIMITSCTASEPRHLVSEELAIFVAGFRRRVLLIDCDTDRSQLSQVLGASELNGMRQLAETQQSLSRDLIEPLIVSTDQDGIDFLPIGAMTNDSSWIDPRQLRVVISLLRSEYDAIIVNGPSVMGSAESLLLAAEVETSLFSVFTNRTRWNQLALCENSANESDVSISGSVLHSGKRSVGRGSTGLQLQLGRKRQNSPAHTQPNLDVQEKELYSTVDQLQRELRLDRSNSKQRGMSSRSTSQNSPLTPNASTQE